MCTSQEAKRFYTLCFSSSFLFNVVIIRHFNTVDTLEMVESGHSTKHGEDGSERHTQHVSTFYTHTLV